MGSAENLIDIDMPDAKPLYWPEVIKQVETLKSRDKNKVLNNVKKDLIRQFKFASESSLSFPAACSLIGISSFIWGVLDLNEDGRNLSKFYQPKELRSLFKQEFFQSLAKYYSRNLPKCSKLAFTQKDLKSDIFERVKVNWKSSLPAKILEAAAGPKNITLCTQKFFDKGWLKTQSQQDLQRVLMQFYGAQMEKEIESLDLENLMSFFEKNLCTDSSYFNILNHWVNGLIAGNTSEEFPTPPPLPVANVSEDPVKVNAIRSSGAAPCSDSEEPQDDGDDSQTSEFEVSTADERSRRATSMTSQTSTSSGVRWKERQKNNNIYAEYNNEEAQAKAESDLKRLKDMRSFTVNHLIAAIRSDNLKVVIQNVQPYGRGYRVAMDVSRGERHVLIFCALKVLPHLYPRSQQSSIESQLEKLRADGRAFTVQKAGRNTTLDSYN